MDFTISVQGTIIRGWVGYHCVYWGGGYIIKGGKSREGVR